MSAIVLAYSGGFASSLAIHWLAETQHADVVTVTLDVGQGDDLAALRSRALACGAKRAHALDARDELVREFLVPSLGAGPVGEGSYPLIDELTRPLIARKLIEVARIERTSVVAHASSDDALDRAVHALDPNVTVLAPAREWQMDATQLSAYAHAHGVAAPRLSGPDCRIDRNLGGSMITFPLGGQPPHEAEPRPSAVQPEHAALDIRFESGVPVAVNDVPMSPVELVESLALIAGRHGVGRLETNCHGRAIVYDAPAALVLRAARAAIGEETGIARLSVGTGRCTVLDANTELVNPA